MYIFVLYVDEVPQCLINDEKELEMFVKFWYKGRNTKPITLSDQIPYEKVKNFYSAFTILSEIKHGEYSLRIRRSIYLLLYDLTAYYIYR